MAVVMVDEGYGLGDGLGGLGLYDGFCMWCVMCEDRVEVVRSRSDCGNRE